MQPGDRVSVKIGRGKSGIQRGTVTRVYPDGRFRWVNANNYARVSRPADVTDEPERAATLDPYVAEWLADEDE